MEMRAAEYTVAGAAGEEPAVLTVYFFPGAGGSVDDNLSRWRDQMETTSEPVIDRREVHDMRVAVIDMTGSMSAMRMPGMPPSPARSGQRFLGAIVEGPEGLVFFKMVGPEAAVATAADPFRQLLETVRPTGP
jgi:hypothetical protein